MKLSLCVFYAIDRLKRLSTNTHRKNKRTLIMFTPRTLCLRGWLCGGCSVICCSIDVVTLSQIAASSLRERKKQTHETHETRAVFMLLVCVCERVYNSNEARHRKLFAHFAKRLNAKRASFDKCVQVRETVKQTSGGDHRTEREVERHTTDQSHQSSQPIYTGSIRNLHTNRMRCRSLVSKHALAPAQQHTLTSKHTKKRSLCIRRCLLRNPLPSGLGLCANEQTNTHAQKKQHNTTLNMEKQQHTDNIAQQLPAGLPGKIRARCVFLIMLAMFMCKFFSFSFLLVLQKTPSTVFGFRFKRVLMYLHERA